MAEHNEFFPANRAKGLDYSKLSKKERGDVVRNLFKRFRREKKINFSEEERDFISKYIDEYGESIEGDGYRIEKYKEVGGWRLIRKGFDIHQSIGRINALLAGAGALSRSQRERVVESLARIEEETVLRNRDLINFFNDRLYSRLIALFPDNKFLRSLKKAPELVDKIRLLKDGKTAFKRILDNIRAARSSIVINMFVWRNDKIGNEIADALLQKAKEGVQIIILKDALGGIWERVERGQSSGFHTDERSFKETMLTVYVNKTDDKKHGGHSKAKFEELLALSRQKGSNVTVIEKNKQMDEYKGDHSKYFVFDDGIVITGGMNVGDEYAQFLEGEKGSGWRDYMIEVRSPFFAQHLVRRMYKGHSGVGGTSVGLSLNRNPQSLREGHLDIGARVVRAFEIKDEMLSMLSGAKEEIVIEMAYFGDREIVEKIVERGRKGLKITIIIPSKANVMDATNKKVMSEILAKLKGRNVSVYLYPGMVHAKLVHVDGKRTFLGSANMDATAMEKLVELNVFVDKEDCEFTRQVRASLKEDLAISTLVTDSVLQLEYSQAEVAMESASARK